MIGAKGTQFLKNSGNMRLGGSSIDVTDILDKSYVFVAERMREGVELQGFEHRKSAGSDRVTVSLGIAGSAPSPDSSPADLIEASREYLDKAREQGGNRVISAD